MIWSVRNIEPFHSRSVTHFLSLIWMAPSQRTTRSYRHEPTFNSHDSNWYLCAIGAMVMCGALHMGARECVILCWTMTFRIDVATLDQKSRIIWNQTSALHWRNTSFLAENYHLYLVPTDAKHLLPRNKANDKSNTTRHASFLFELFAHGSLSKNTFINSLELQKVW